MNFFGNLTEADRVLFEGYDVWKVTPKVDPETKKITHYILAVYTDSEAQIRTFCPDEITSLIEAERLVIDRGYYSLKRVEDRRMHGRKELYLAGKKTTGVHWPQGFSCRAYGSLPPRGYDSHARGRRNFPVEA